MQGPFHTGVVVDDLAEAMASYGEALGLEWAVPKHSTHPLRSERGLLPRDTWVTFSLQGPHHLELLEHADSTAFDHLPGAPRINHLGYWVDDLPSEIRRLEMSGLRCRLHAEDAEGWLSRMAYLESAQGGLYVELVDSDLRDEFSAWWSSPTHQPPSAPGRSFPVRDIIGPASSGSPR